MYSIVWPQSLTKWNAHEPSNWGWRTNERKYTPIWMTIPEAAKTCIELVKGGCKTFCQGNCKRKKHSLPCTELCKCGGNC